MRLCAFGCCFFC